MSRSALKVGYAWASTEEEDLTAPSRWSRPSELNPTRIYVDHGLMGRTEDRDGLRQAMTACRGSDTFVVTTFDRPARSVRDAHGIADKLAAQDVKLGIEGTAYDPSGPTGTLSFNVLAMVAEFTIG